MERELKVSLTIKRNGAPEVSTPLPHREGIGGESYEEFTILGCAVEDDSSSHHGGSHRADHDVMYGLWPVLRAG